MVRYNNLFENDKLVVYFEAKNFRKKFELFCSAKQV